MSREVLCFIWPPKWLYKKNPIVRRARAQRRLNGPAFFFQTPRVTVVGLGVGAFDEVRLVYGQPVIEVRRAFHRHPVRGQHFRRVSLVHRTVVRAHGDPGHHWGRCRRHIRRFDHGPMVLGTGQRWRQRQQEQEQEQGQWHRQWRRRTGESAHRMYVCTCVRPGTYGRLNRAVPLPPAHRFVLGLNFCTVYANSRLYIYIYIHTSNICVGSVPDVYHRNIFDHNFLLKKKKR